MKLLAPAKINLFLSVGPRRGDGYHEISSLMQSISLMDSLLIAPSSTFSLDVSPAGVAPEDESNLIVKAARALWGSLGRTDGASIALEKSIPAAAGLGGGSSDAAAALIGFNELWEAGLSRKALGKIGAAVGADVPFCVVGGTCAVRGAGEIVTPMPLRTPLWWVIAVPEAQLSTAAVYQEFDRLVPAASAEDPFELADALARGDLEKIAAGLRNDLTDAACALEPSVARVLDSLRSAGSLGAVMTGSGTGCAGLCRDEEHAKSVARLIEEKASFVAIANSVSHGPRISQK